MVEDWKVPELQQSGGGFAVGALIVRGGRPVGLLVAQIRLTDCGVSLIQSDPGNTA